MTTSVDTKEAFSSSFDADFREPKTVTLTFKNLRQMTEAFLQAQTELMEVKKAEKEAQSKEEVRAAREAGLLATTPEIERLNKEVVRQVNATIDGLTASGEAFWALLRETNRYAESLGGEAEWAWRDLQFDVEGWSAFSEIRSIVEKYYDFEGMEPAAS